MKLVIDIDEEEYNNIKGIKYYISEIRSGKRLTAICLNAIANGIPLPKGHGDLVDRNDLSLMTVHLIDGTFVCDAPTIIEADKGE